MPHFKVTLAYDGATFVGWQRQAKSISIQGLVEDALADLDGRAVTVTGAGRTDAGVHALGQVAGFTLARAMDPASVVRALNARLPETVRVVDGIEVSDTFHARFDARQKTYRYRIWNEAVMSPFERGRAWHVPAPRLDVEQMMAAASVFRGRHDFAAFQATGTETQSTERVVIESRVCRVDAELGALLQFEITGEGFLRHMVRIMVGTLVEVGRGRRSVDWVGEVLASRHRVEAGPTAPPEGLFLVGVLYE